jgi:hypothetical protein
MSNITSGMSLLDKARVVFFSIIDTLTMGFTDLAGNYRKRHPGKDINSPKARRGDFVRAVPGGVTRTVG